MFYYFKFNELETRVYNIQYLSINRDGHDFDFKASYI